PFRPDTHRAGGICVGGILADRGADGRGAGGGSPSRGSATQIAHAPASPADSRRVGAGVAAGVTALEPPCATKTVPAQRGQNACDGTRPNVLSREGPSAATVTRARIL